MADSDDIKKRLEQCPWREEGKENIIGAEILRDHPSFKHILPQSLEELKEQYISGDKSALAKTISQCFMSRVAVPQWARFEFVRGFYAVQDLECDSWNDSLGWPVPKGKQKARYKHKANKAIEVHSEVFAILEENPAARLSDEVVEEAGLRHEIGKSLAWEYYSYCKAEDPAWHSICEGDLELARLKYNYRKSKKG